MPLWVKFQGRLNLVFAAWRHFPKTDDVNPAEMKS